MVMYNFNNYNMIQKDKIKEFKKELDKYLQDETEKLKEEIKNLNVLILNKNETIAKLNKKVSNNIKLTNNIEAYVVKVNVLRFVNKDKNIIEVDKGEILMLTQKDYKEIEKQFGYSIKGEPLLNNNYLQKVKYYTF